MHGTWAGPSLPSDGEQAVIFVTAFLHHQTFSHRLSVLSLSLPTTLPQRGDRKDLEYSDPIAPAWGIPSPARFFGRCKRAVQGQSRTSENQFRAIGFPLFLAFQPEELQRAAGSKSQSESGKEPFALSLVLEGWSGPHPCRKG